MHKLSKNRLLILLFLLLVVMGCSQDDPTPTPDAATAEPATATPAPVPTDTAVPPTPTIESTILNELTLSEAAPRLIGRSPEAGGELPLTAPVELYFDQPMDPATTSAALRLVSSDGSDVPGTVEWVQPRIVRFQPQQALSPSQLYQLTIGEQATSDEGVSLTEALTLDVITVGEVEIAQVSPPPAAAAVTSDSAITVIFNRPIVPLAISQEQDDFPSPIEISPPAEGNGRWVNTSVYVWRPTEPLRGRERYDVRVDAAVVNDLVTTGATLADDYSWSFSIAAPTINRISLPGLTDYPRPGYQHLPLDQSFRVYFNQPMDTEITERMISVASIQETMPLTFDWNDMNTYVTITPTRLLALGTEYVLTVSPEAESAFGGRLANGLTWNTTTALTPQIVRTMPADGTTADTFSSRFSIDFASRMDRDSLEGKVIFDPPILGDPNGQYNSWAWQLNFWGLEPSTDYTVTILPGMADPYGNTINEERVVRFRTAPYTASAELQMHPDLALYRQGGSTAVWTSYRNASRLDFDVSRLTLPTFVRLVDNYSARDRGHDPNNKVVERSVDVAAGENVRDYVRFDLTNESGESLDPGFYLVTLNGPGIPNRDRLHVDARPVMVANANVTLKTTHTEMLAWVTDLTTGEPIEGVPVVLYDSEYGEITRATTDAEGVAYADNLDLSVDWSARFYAVTDSDSVFGAALSNWSEGVNPYDFGINTNYYTQPGQAEMYIYTDRPIYRPGQTVYYKGIVRFNDDLRYTLPEAGRELDVSIYSYDGLVAEQTVVLNEMGTFEGELVLDDEAVLGGYGLNLSFNVGEQSFSGNGNFNVAEYRKPTFQVDVNPEADDVLAGQTWQAVVDAEFFSGGSVANGEVDWTLRSADATFDPGGQLTPYSFNNREQDRGYFYNFGIDYGTFIASGNGRTNGNGEYVVEIPAELVDQTSTSRFTLEASVTDIAGNVVSGRADVLIHPSELYGGIRPGNRVAEAGEPLDLNGVVVDWEGQLLSGRDVTIDVVERRWYSVQEEDDNGNVIWQTSVEEIPAETIEGLTTDENGRVTASFTPPNGGVFRAYIITSDDSGNQSRTSTYFWAAGDGYVPWRRINDHSFELIPDADRYDPGDTAELLIASPFQGDAYALVTVERGHIYQRDVVPISGNSTVYELPITGDMAPNIFVSVMVVKGVDDFSEAPDFKVGMAQFEVSRQEQELDIQITPDRELLGPQDTVTYDIQVTDFAGQPVDAELSLSLVDLAVLQLSDPNSPPIIDFFYSKQWLSVRTALLLTKEMDSFNAELQEQIKGGGGGGGGGGVLSIREEFKDTAYWSAQLRTDADGRAQVSVELPDNLTTWRLDVRAVTADTKVGQTTADVRTTRPLLVSPQTPRFFIVGDEAAVGTTVRNTTDERLETTVYISATGVTVGTAVTQTVTLDPNGQAYVSWPVTVPDVDRVDFVFAARSGDYADAARPEIGSLDGGGLPVYKYEVPETVGTSGQLLDGGAVVESIALPIFPNQPNYIPTQGEVSIKLEPSLAAAMTDGLDYLEHYPYECTEQIVSKFLPNVLTTKALNEAGLADEALRDNLETEVNTALQRLYARQLPNGGWPWWTGTRANELVSAYVLLGLIEARDAGYTVREGAITSGTNYLNGALNAIDDLDGRFRLNRQAFMVYVLARAGEMPTGAANRLYDEREVLDLYAKALLGESLLLMNADDERIDTLMSDFISDAIVSATGTHWEEDGRDYWNWNTDTRTTAIVMNFMAKVDTDNPLVANSVRRLMAHRSNGHWSTTQETAWTIMGLTTWMVESGELNADYAYEVALNGDLLAAGEANADTLRDRTELSVAITDLLTDQLNRVAIGRTNGEGNLYYTTHMNIYLPVPEVEPRDNGIVISRQYFRPDAPERPIDTAEQTETVLAKLTIVVPNSLHYVIIDDWLPAGLEAIDTSLRTSEQQGQGNEFEGGQRTDIQSDYFRDGWGWWYFDHVQLRDEKVEISADYLPAGTYEYVYLARAVTPGTFNVIPPTAQEFYFPEVYGRGAGMSFTVLPQGADMPDTAGETAAETESERISFAAGESAGEVTGLLDAGRSRTYLVQAAADQTMSVEVLSPRSDVSLAVFGPDGAQVGQAAANVARWEGVLPADGDYEVRVSSVGGNTSYALTVAVE